jgi:hypothetical protein
MDYDSIVAAVSFADLLLAVAAVAAAVALVKVGIRGARILLGFIGR